MSTSKSNFGATGNEVLRWQLNICCSGHMNI